MLKALRHKKTAKRIFIFLAIIIVPAFVLWGSGSMVRDKAGADYAGEIFGKKISFQDYRDALKAVQDQAVIQFGDRFNQIRPLLDMEKLAWERLIVLHKANLEKIRISDEEVVRTIAGYPFFEKNGKFDDQIYRQVLRFGLETTPKEFEKHIRESLEIAALFKKYTKDVNLSDKEILNEYKRENEKVKVGYLSFPAQDFKAGLTVTDKETKDYFDKHSSEFLTDPAIDIDYIGLDFGPKATAEEKQKAKTQVLLIAETAKKDKNWDSLSQSHNLAYKHTGYFYINEPIPGIGWSTQFYEAVLPLKINEVSPAIETEQGIFLARLLGLRQPHIPEFNQIKDKVLDKIKEERAKVLSLAKAQSLKGALEDKLKSNADFQKCAKELNLRVKETEAFKRNQYIETIGLSPEFSDAAFSLVDKPAQLAVINTPQASYIIKLLQFTPIDLKKFEAEKKEFTQALRNKKSEQALIEFLDKLKNQARLKSNATTQARTRRYQ